MNILFLADHPFHYKWGGVNAVTRTLATQLKKMGHNAFLISYCQKPSEVNENEVKDVYFIDRNNPENVKIFNDFIKENKIDFLINQSWERHIYTFLRCCDLKDLKTISVIHSQPFPTKGKERKIKSLSFPKCFKDYINKYLTLLCPYLMVIYKTKQNRRTYDNFSSISDKIGLLSENYKPRVLKYYPNFNSDKLIYINNPTTFQIESINDIQEDKENIILWVGRIAEPEKNIKGFLHIWKLFYKTHLDWKAILVGDGPQRVYYEKYANRSNLRNLEFVGSQSNVAEFYKRSKILCMTSLYEGWPMVIMEAMAYGCVPVIFNSFEAASEMIDNNETGVIIKAFDSHAFVKALDKLAGNENLWIKMSRKCLEKVKNFLPEIITEKWINLLKEL